MIELACDEDRCDNVKLMLGSWWSKPQINKINNAAVTQLQYGFWKNGSILS